MQLQHYFAGLAFGAVLLCSSPALAQVDCANPDSLGWLKGGWVHWDAPQRDVYWMNWRNPGNEDFAASDARPFAIAHGQLPIEVDYDLRLAGSDMTLSSHPASGSRQFVLKSCTEDYWSFSGDPGGVVIARGGDDVFGFFYVPTGGAAQGNVLLRREIASAPAADVQAIHDQLLRDTVPEAVESLGVSP